MTALKGMQVVVIGAGFGGLAAAAHLARAGASVTVVEKASTVGGKAAYLARGGFVFDSGPTLLTLPWIAAETFATAGVRLADVAPLARIEPVCRYVVPGGGELVVSADPAATRASIARFDAEDAARWEGFLRECKDIWEAAGEAYLDAPFEGYFGFSQRLLRRGAKVAKLGAGRGTLDDLARRHFRSAPMRAFVGHFATYAGASPFHASAALAMIPYIEVCLGAFYPRGGMHALAVELARAVEARGVRILKGAEVTHVHVDPKGRATGVTFREDGAAALAATTHLEADAVVANVDPLIVTSQLLPAPRRRDAGLAKLAARTPSMSGFGWAFGIEGAAQTRAVNTMLFADDFPGEMRAVFDEGRMADDPTVWVSIPSLLDPSRAPEGHHTVFALTYAPASGVTVDWDREARRLRALVLARLEREWGPGLEPRIREEAFVTPRDIGRTGSADGAIYGAAPNGALAAFERPANRASGMSGLYFVGGATHPGGGVTLVMRGGRFVSELLEQDARSGVIGPAPG